MFPTNNTMVNLQVTVNRRYSLKIPFNGLYGSQEGHAYLYSVHLHENVEQNWCYLLTCPLNNLLQSSALSKISKL